MIVGVPGKQVGWMSRHGHKLNFDSQGQASCPESNLKYALVDNNGVSSVHCVDLDEEADLPAKLAVGNESYRDISQ